jgi:hypothetical protein
MIEDEECEEHITKDFITTTLRHFTIDYLPARSARLTYFPLKNINVEEYIHHAYHILEMFPRISNHS